MGPVKTIIKKHKAYKLYVMSAFQIKIMLSSFGCKMHQNVSEQTVRSMGVPRLKAGNIMSLTEDVFKGCLVSLVC